jgi:hypothetical protein
MNKTRFSVRPNILRRDLWETMPKTPFLLKQDHVGLWGVFANVAAKGYSSRYLLMLLASDDKVTSEYFVHGAILTSNQLKKLKTVHKTDLPLWIGTKYHSPNFYKLFVGKTTGS